MAGCCDGAAVRRLDFLVDTATYAIGLYLIRRPAGAASAALPKGLSLGALLVAGATASPFLH
jgi:hypothetical protein